MTASLKMKLIIAAIAIVIITAIILAACGIASSLGFWPLVVAVLSFLVGMGVGAYVYKIYKQIKANKTE